MGELLSKSRIIAWRQCPRRLWLEIHRPELKVDDAATESSYQIGHQVGDIARRLYDPAGRGETIDARRDGYAHAFERTRQLMQGDAPVFEAGFRAGGALAFADVMLPDGRGGWRMVEVKSSTSVKDYHRDDVAVQSHLCRQSGVVLSAVSLAHVNRDFVYPGGGDYRGLLAEADLTADAFGRDDEVRAWIDGAHATAALPAEPDVAPGSHCKKPFACGFIGHCSAGLPVAEFPAHVLPAVRTKALKARLAMPGGADLREIDDALLNGIQRRVKAAMLDGVPYVDADGARRELARWCWPLYFLDFETAQLAVPVWPQWRPYEQACFQFSVHIVDQDLAVTHHAYIDLSGGDPSRRFAEALIERCAGSGSIVVYNASFERTRIDELGRRHADLDGALRALANRIADLHPIVLANYYHPMQAGSFSIKAVLPAIVPELDYGNLDEVQSGAVVSERYVEAALADLTPPERRAQIRQSLLEYCRLDTWAMVRIWAYLAGKDPGALKDARHGSEGWA